MFWWWVNRENCQGVKYQDPFMMDALHFHPRVEKRGISSHGCKRTIYIIDFFFGKGLWHPAYPIWTMYDSICYMNLNDMIWYDMMSLSKKCWLLPWFVAFCWSWSAESYFDNAAPPNKSWRNPNCTVEITVKIQRSCSFQRSPFQIEGPGQCLVAQEKMYSRPRSKPKPRSTTYELRKYAPKKKNWWNFLSTQGTQFWKSYPIFP